MRRCSRFRIEAAYSKDKILELYLNEIYLGLGNYGVAAAALNYFGKSVHELTIAEAAYLAALPKAPNNYHPFRSASARIERRNYVIDRMVENDYISRADGEKAKSEPLGVNPRVLSPNTYAAGYFAEEVRRELGDRYGEKKLYEGGLSVRTTLDPKMQVMARKALVDGLVRFDEAHGFRGAMRHIDISADWGLPLADVPDLGDVKPWRLAVVLDANDATTRVGLQPGREKSGEVGRERETALLTQDGVKWTRRVHARAASCRATSSMSSRSNDKPGQVAPAPDPRDFRRDRRHGPLYRPRLRDGRRLLLRPIGVQPRDAGAAPARLRRSSRSSMRRRSTTATRRPRSCSTSRSRSTRATAKSGGRKISRHGGTGPHTLRYGVEHSKNLMTVRLAHDVGMPLIAEYAKRFGIYDDMPPFLSMSLGAGETTVLQDGHRLFDVCQWRQPHQADLDRPHPGPLGPHDLPPRRARLPGLRRDRNGANQSEPKLVDKREQVLDPLTAYQITSIMEGVIQRGTGQSIQRRRQASRRQDRHDERRQGPLVRRLLARSRRRRVHRLRQAAFARRTRRRPRRTPRRSSATS